MRQNPLFIISKRNNALSISESDFKANSTSVLLNNVLVIKLLQFSFLQNQIQH